ncbi:NAD(P)/FAD-dependent oxidoreductase [Achromobacter sp. GG226]|uniref:NAD(P)/FAD-dependent oxidoreductase n=1 Tax=Verticiella alkaliphila TaxID=2779529 RepID=UPI001C0AFC85|nr:NAD(P)/FAD-dependent oxidoreductase [Verticiella sp. GG226]MBU4611237.1 NAD(P)/FAD-dependent oxidoreductase [Verticiella sp. GG226]
MTDYDCIIAGAGVVGLAIARAVAATGRSVLIAEAADAYGTATSARNSEVIHAGIYYPAGSLKARLCVEGKTRLYAYCAERNVPARQVGKLIVATAPDQVARLAGIQAQARVNGVDDLVYLEGTEARTLEPALACEAALLSPATGIVDSHALMQSLLADAQAYGADLVVRTPVLAAEPSDEGWAVAMGGDEPITLSASWFINAAGLHAPALAARITGMPPQDVPQAFFCKGTYAALAGRAPFSRLIYPVPEAAGLGVHLTLDLAGQARFGPDTEWVSGEEYGLDAARLAGFEAAVRAYWPGLPTDALTPTYAGVRPKITGPGVPAADFVLQGPQVHGLTGLMNLFGIESPGLTSCLAIADEVLSRLEMTGEPPMSGIQSAGLA